MLMLQEEQKNKNKKEYKQKKKPLLAYPFAAVKDIIRATSSRSYNNKSAREL